MTTQTYTVTVDEEGNRFWYNSQHRYHRTEGPAVEYADGDRAWYLNGQRHRTDGPAVEYTDGHREWWLNGQYHRTDGPAVEWANGHREWWLNGQVLPEQEWQARVNPSTCAGRIVEIDGRKYRLTPV